MTSIKNYIKEHPQALFALYAPVHFIWFFFLEKWTDRDFTILHLAIDDKIPFVSWFIVPYYSWFAFVVFFCLYFYFKTPKKEAIRMYSMLTCGMAFSLLLYTIWPNALELRPEAITGNDFFSNLVKGLYKTDTSTNVCPSLHVYNTLVIAIAFLSSPNFKGKFAAKLAMLTVSLSIIASTVFLKQHSVIDVIAALLLAGILYFVFYFKKSN